MTVLLGGSPGATEDRDASDTDKWKVVFTDKFDRDKVGDNWKIAFGEWTIEDGALKGQLRKGGGVGEDNYSTGIVLKGAAMPATVEVRYETWSPDEVGSEAKFLTGDIDGGIVMAFLGVDHGVYKEKGTMLFVKRQKSFRRVGSNKEAVLTPKVRHKVRLVREDDRMTLSLDGKEILSANVSSANNFHDLKLNLQGTWGKEGSIVYFDNLEVRIPPGQGKW